MSELRSPWFAQSKAVMQCQLAVYFSSWDLSRKEKLTGRWCLRPLAGIYLFSFAPKTNMETAVLGQSDTVKCQWISHFLLPCAPQVNWHWKRRDATIRRVVPPADTSPATSSTSRNTKEAQTLEAFSQTWNFGTARIRSTFVL